MVSKTPATGAADFKGFASCRRPQEKSPENVSKWKLRRKIEKKGDMHARKICYVKMDPGVVFLICKCARGYPKITKVTETRFLNRSNLINRHSEVASLKDCVWKLIQKIYRKLTENDARDVPGGRLGPPWGRSRLVFGSDQKSMKK